MMDFLIIATVSFLVAILTFFSGFGLGTILTPVFMIFFPVQLAIALTGVVHFFNNMFKIILVGKKADKGVFLLFGIPAIIAAFFGAWLLIRLEINEPIISYNLGGHEFQIFTFKLMVAVLLMIFAIMDLLPFFKNLEFSRSKLPLGGILSGFFGGLTGNQGALRAAFLVKAGLTKEAFIGTTVLVSTCVDLTRLSMYSVKFMNSGLKYHLPLVITATLAGITGSFIGNKLLKKVTLPFIKVTVAILLMLLAFALGLGFV